MTNKTWIIEQFSEYNGLQYLIEEIKAQKLESKIIDWTKVDEPKIPTNVSDIVFFGSQELGQKYKGKGSVFLGNEKFLASNIVSELVLNSGRMFSLNKVIENIEHILDDYNGAFFIRPDSWEKFFAGQVINKSNYKKSLENISRHNEFDVDVIVSSLKEIKEEYRIICVNNTMVTASIYKKEGKDLQEEIECKRFNDIFVQIKKENLLPDSHCTVDLALTETGLKLIEFNPLSTSAIYRCNPKKIIEALK